MALKDKLMTLEDFKAVRDVDVASNSAQFTEIKADLDAVEDTIDNVGMSATAKAALLECLRHVVYDNNDIDYVGALENAIYPYAGIIYVTKGLGVSGNAITSNTKRAVTTEIPFNNTAPITIKVNLDNEAASEYVWNFRILDTAGSLLTFAEINGTFKFMRDGAWTIGDGNGWYNHSHEMTYVEDQTIATVRCVASGKSAKDSMILLIAGTDTNADIPATPLSGDIIIQGIKYRLEEAES